MKIFSQLAFGTLALVHISGLAWGQSYPTKPMRIITAGAGTFHDIVTRHVAQRLSDVLGQPVVVENRPGAAMAVASTIVARAAPDGHTLLMADRSALAVAPHMYKDLPFDVARDLAPISLCARTPSVLVVNAALPVSTLREFIDFAKRNPVPLDFAAGGIGTASHIANELFRQLAGVKLVNVHYKGGGPATLAIISGEVKAGNGLVANVLPHVKAGKLKALVVTSKSRFPLAPDIPSAVEAGLPELDSEFWIGMLAPARLPPVILDRLSNEVTQALTSETMQSALRGQGAEPATSTPAEFGAFIQSETEKWGRVIRTAGITPQ